MSTLNALSAVSAQSSSERTSTTSPLGQGNSVGKEDFLKLLVAQLRNQDPLKPMEDSQFIAQLAQFNVLEQMQQMNASFKSMMTMEQLTLGSNLIGKTVEALDPVTRTSFEGVVSQVRMVGGVAKLTIGDRTIDLKDVTRVR